jgi:hypothetical protein
LPSWLLDLDQNSESGYGSTDLIESGSETLLYSLIYCICGMTFVVKPIQRVGDPHPQEVVTFWRDWDTRPANPRNRRKGAANDIICMVSIVFWLCRSPMRNNRLSGA